MVFLYLIPPDGTCNFVCLILLDMIFGSLINILLLKFGTYSSCTYCPLNVATFYICRLVDILTILIEREV